MAGPEGADGGAVGLPFTGDAAGLCAYWLEAKPPTTAGEPDAAFAEGEGCCPFVALAYEERALEDVVPEALAGLPDLLVALIGVEADWTVLDMSGRDGWRSRT